MQFLDKGRWGPDVSHYQDDNLTPQKIDFQKMKAYGADFVIIRAGQGTRVDEDFQDNWKAAKDAGLPRAAYWYYDPRFSPLAQARTFVSLFHNDPPEGRLWADFEFPDSWGGAYNHPGDMEDFLEEVRSSGAGAGVYTADWWWYPHVTKIGHSMAYFSTFPLWVAQYGVKPEDVILPRGWTSALMWQDGTPAIGPLVGVESKEVDHNRWNDLFDFAQEWGQAPAEGETPMTSKFYVWNADAANIRSGPSTAYPIIGNLVRGDVIQVDEPFMGTWARIVTAQHADGSYVALKSGALILGRDDCWCTDAYLKEVAGLPLSETPPPPPPPEPSTQHVVEVYIDGVLEFRKELS